MNRLRPVRLGLILLAMASAPAVPQANDDWQSYLMRLTLPTRGDQIRLPRSVAVDLHGDEVLVCDTLRHRLLIFDLRGLLRFEIRGGALFRSPFDLAVDPEGYIFLLAGLQGSSGIALLDFDGRFIAEIPLVGVPEDLAPVQLVSISLSPSGDRMYLVDSANKRLWIADRDGAVRAAVDLTIELPDDEALGQVLGHVDVFGDTVLVAQSTGGRVDLFDLDGQPRGSVGRKGTGSCQTARPVAAALDADGNVIILDKQRAQITRWDPRSSRCLGEHAGFGNAPGALYQPDDLAMDRAGQIYVSQGFEGRVQMFTTASRPSGVEAIRPPAPLEALRARGAPTPAPLPVDPPETLGEPQPENQADAQAALMDAFQEWARAWSERQADEYLEFYSTAFSPPSAMKIEHWRAQRRASLDRAAFIEVMITRVQIELTATDKARVIFDQVFQSDTFAENVRKAQEWVLEDGGWKILSERVEEIL